MLLKFQELGLCSQHFPSATNDLKRTMGEMSTLEKERKKTEKTSNFLFESNFQSTNHNLKDLEFFKFLEKKCNLFPGKIKKYYTQRSSSVSIKLTF